MYTKIMQNTKFVYILYTNILHKSKFCMNVQKMYIIQNLYKVQTESSLKLEMYVFCTYKQCTNYTKPIQLPN